MDLSQLKYQNNVEGLNGSLRDIEGLLINKFDMLDGVVDKVTISDSEFEPFILDEKTCSIPVELTGDITGRQHFISAKSVKSKVRRDTLLHSYLVDKVIKGSDGNGEFLDELHKLILGEVSNTVMYEVLKGIIEVGMTDAKVTKIVPNGTTPREKISSLVGGLSDKNYKALYNGNDGDKKVLFVSSQFYAELVDGEVNPQYIGDSGLIIGQIDVYPIPQFVYSDMVLSTYKNIIPLTNSKADFKELRIVKYDEIYSDYLVMYLSIGGAYKTADKLVLASV